MTGEPVVSVIIPARNAEKTISRTLRGLSRQDLERPYEVIVVDNASTDETARIVSESGLGVRVLEGDGSGPGRARNLGADAARASTLAFTDADCEPQPGWLRSGLEALAGGDLVQGAVEPDPAARRRPFDRSVRVSSARGLFETANMLVSRSLFDEVGGFMDWLTKTTRATEGSTASETRPFGEDLQFGWKARRLGARTVFAPSAVVHHHVFSRGPIGYALERLRLRYFPAVAREIPETRAETFFWRYFLTPRSAAFDLMVIAVAAALLLRTPLPAAGVLPYLLTTTRAALRMGPRWAPIVVSVDLVADALALASLAWGSLRYRALLL